MAWTRGRILGRGSSATVSLAMHRQSGEFFAVKSAELSRSEFLQREQSILSSINSPRIIGYVGCDVTNENGQLLYNLFIEYISGGTITDAIRDQGGRLHESAIRSHTRSILQGLHYLHSHGLVHCDIKGRNILVGDNGTKIADFGCARWVGDQVPAVPIAGTPLFMAPEVARGEEQSFPADIWSLACTIIEMATGLPPWPDVTVMIFNAEEANDFLGKCLKRDPKKRWTSQELLKHPFLESECSVQVNSKQIQSPTTSTSPTSILNQGFWQSLESEVDTAVKISNQLVLCSSSNSASKRIQLVIGSIPSSSPTPSLLDWTWGDDWITVRRNNDAVSVGHDETMIPTEEDIPSSSPTPSLLDWTWGDDWITVRRNNDAVFVGHDETMIPTEEEELELLGRSSSVVNDHSDHNSVNNSNNQESLYMALQLFLYFVIQIMVFEGKGNFVLLQFQFFYNLKQILYSLNQLIERIKGLKKSSLNFFHSLL
ncbi:hypothetical protein NE237_000248 [Protea cynaroides]|uniref:Protein kinase domain-containing protein n=1 Tax=Protea cynaroides TaxID=273540 RepID=A0A9Q0KQU5_9MAGN|nr:hypothetical protein NE237_000248 [Protea cynaroides]